MAGLPWFSAPFGRDALIASLQTLGLNPDIASGTLSYLAADQGTKVDPSRDEQPGKILHERRFGELANLKQIPHTPYYGSVDSTPLFLVTLVELMDWVNDRDLFVELLPAMSAALDWIDKYGDLDHDGFVEYGDHAPRGIRNQGWKDSHDSLLMPGGKPAERPIALVEVQGYVYHAKAGLARILDRLGETGAAQQLAIEAGDLRRRFEQHFWQDDHQFYAQALDGAKELVPSITSNPVHCLSSRIGDAERADIVTDRLLAPDMFSGWGIRTLSAGSPHYNPMSYHNGTIWPHDNSLIAAGLRRYGHTEAAQQVVTGILEAGIRMPSFRLPELFCGFGRDTRFGTGPAEYLVSCNPQAWGAGAAFHLLQTALGIFPDTTAGRVFLSPMPIPLARSVEVRGMRVGAGHLSFPGTYDGGPPEGDIAGAAQGIREAALETGSNLLLLESGARDDGLWTNALEDLLYDPPCDVALLRTEAAAPPITSILLAVRGGPSAELAVQLARTIRASTGASLTLLHIFDPRQSPEQRAPAGQTFASLTAQVT